MQKELEDKLRMVGVNRRERWQKGSQMDEPRHKTHTQTKAARDTGRARLLAGTRTGLLGLEACGS